MIRNAVTIKDKEGYRHEFYWYGIFSIYYLVPKKYRYVVLAIGNYILYGWGSVGVLNILLLTTNVIKLSYLKKSRLMAMSFS